MKSVFTATFRLSSLSLSGPGWSPELPDTPTTSLTSPCSCFPGTSNPTCPEENPWLPRPHFLSTSSLTIYLAGKSPSRPPPKCPLNLFPLLHPQDRPKPGSHPFSSCSSLPSGLQPREESRHAHINSFDGLPLKVNPKLAAWALRPRDLPAWLVIMRTLLQLLKRSRTRRGPRLPTPATLRPGPAAFPSPDSSCPRPCLQHRSYQESAPASQTWLSSCYI